MNILFISEMLPIDTFASEVVFYRHFERLIEEGHQVHVITDENSYTNRRKNLDSRFQIHLLPNRKWYYPPYHNQGIFQDIRFYDYFQNYVKEIITTHQVTHLLGFVYRDFLAPFCAYVKRRTNLPLISFYHDDTIELNQDADGESMRYNTAKILNASDCILCVTPELIENWPMYEQKAKILFPIPEETTFKKDFPTQINTIAYAGSVYNEIIKYLDQFADSCESLAVKLTIIGNNSAASYLAEKYQNTSYQNLFITSEESNNYLMKNADLCIIPYPDNITEMPWIRTCFPSKFIQYCLLGIPTLIIAPEDSAIGKWCQVNNWPLYLKKYNTQHLKNLLSSKELLVLTKLKLRELPDFDPHTIHQKFLKILDQN